MTSRWEQIVRSAAPGCELSDEFEAVLTRRVLAAVAAWPNVKLDPAQLVRAIAQRLACDAPLRSLEAMHTDDLYLACGCAAGDPGAIAGFEERCGSVIARAIASTGASAAERADLGQVVRQRLLVTSAIGGVARIATYSARGTLPSWVRVVATREAARLLPAARRYVAADDEELEGLIASGDDPEIGYFKRLYREEFKRAFRAAVAALDDRARLLLQQHLLDGLSIDRLAALHGVHRATVARWVDGARDAVLGGVQREMLRRLRLSRTEVASIVRLIRSQLDVSLSRVLRDPA